MVGKVDLCGGGGRHTGWNLACHIGAAIVQDMLGGHRGLQWLLLLAVGLALATGAAGGEGDRDDRDVEGAGVCRNEPCASCESDDQERKFLQAERLLRSVLQETGDAEARESMHKRIRELLDHGGGRPSRKTPLAAEEKPNENLVLFNDEMMRQLREEVRHPLFHHSDIFPAHEQLQTPARTCTSRSTSHRTGL